MALFCTVCALSAGVRAQSSTPPPAPPHDVTTTTTTATTNPGTSHGGERSTARRRRRSRRLEKYTVSDVPISEQILPTVRPINDSVYGDDRDIVDIPRSVSSVNAAWMEDRQVTNAMDLGQFAPGVYAAADYGIPGVPQIRGDDAQIAVNGQISIPTHRNSTPPSCSTASRRWTS